MHVFKFSRRKGTIADKMEGQIDEKVKTIRSNKLIELSSKMSNDYRKCFVGKEKEVLIEEFVCIDNKPYAVGYTDNYIKVHLFVGSENSLKVNDIVNAVLGPYNEKNGMMEAKI